MKLSFAWLNDFVDLDGLTAEEVAEKLTMGAFEVEEITTFGPDLTGPVVVGQIAAIEAHPNADKIRLTKVIVAEGEEPREIVCGAWNIEVGQKIPVALPGALVVNRHDGSQLAIKQSKIRGVVSNGMLCSAPEIGVDGSGEGILILDPSTPLGIDVIELLHLKKDFILHVTPRSNRGDALCVSGIAREVSVLCRRPLRAQAFAEQEVPVVSGSAAGNGASAQSDSQEQPAKEEVGKAVAQLARPAETAQMTVRIEDLADCPFFSARVLSGIKIGPSPAWMARRLESVGVRPVNNVVDITNYVLQELGQPMHAYDMEVLRRLAEQAGDGRSGADLVVRRARKGERLQTIDGRERELEQEALVIASGSEVVGVAGVMGGKTSEISDATTSIVLEAASFNSAVVRRTSRLLGLSSDSSLRFERGVDTASVRAASQRASALLVEHCHARAGELVTAGCDRAAVVRLELRMSELKRITEIDMTADEAGDLLLPLGFACQLAADEYSAGILHVQVPSFRQRDVAREIDLIEEICRLWGYDRIPASLPSRAVTASPLDEFIAALRQALTANGLNECWTTSLVSREDLDGRGAFDPGRRGSIEVLNPLSPDHQALRRSLLPGLLKVAAYNQDRGCSSPWIFEVGRVYDLLEEPRPEGVPEFKWSGTKESRKVAAVIAGEPLRGLWAAQPRRLNDGSELYFLLKGVLENLLECLSIGPARLEFQSAKSGWFHPGRAASLGRVAGTDEAGAVSKADSGLIGTLGEIHPEIIKSYNLRGRVCGFELDVEALRSAVRPTQLKEIHSTPFVQRDLTVDLSESVLHAQVESCIKSSCDETLQSVELVSIFDLGGNTKSLSYRLTFQHPAQTLTAEQVESHLTSVRQQLSEALGGRFRA